MYRVYLTEPADPGGVTVDIGTSSTRFFPGGPMSLVENQDSKSATVGTSVKATSTGTISATLGVQTVYATLTTTTVDNFTFCVDPDRAQGGQGNRRLTGYIRLPYLAPSPGGTVISITTSNSSVASVPSSITIPAGGNTGSFGVDTHSVDTESSATITVSDGTNMVAHDVTMLLPHLKEVNVTRATCTAGGTETGTIVLLADASPSGTTVSLTTNSGNITVPATVTVAGNARTASFTVQCLTAGPATIFAELRGRVRSRNITVN